jgi:LmbE family N-acetylglucosaminyl deacetylase
MLDWLDRRVLIVAAHPDDETIGAGAQFVNFRNVVVAHVTDGAPRSLGEGRGDYARARRAELAAALRAGGAASVDLREIGLVDQEASFHLAGLATRLAELLLELRPEIVLTHPYEGGHPDHDTTAFAVHTALGALEREAPVLLEFTSYHDRNGSMITGEFLPFEGCDEMALVLTPQVRERKRRMIDCFVTQHEVLANFSVNYERFRTAPHYDFTRPPHAGTLFYERFEWGITGERWRDLAREALNSLARQVRFTV